VIQAKKTLGVHVLMLLREVERKELDVGVVDSLARELYADLVVLLGYFKIIMEKLVECGVSEEALKSAEAMTRIDEEKLREELRERGLLEYDHYKRILGEECGEVY